MAQTDQKAPATFELDWEDVPGIEDDLLATFVIEQYKSAKARRKDWEAAASQQMAWVEGFQGKKWDPKLRDLQSITYQLEHRLPFDQREPIQINSLKAVVLQRIAMLLGGPTILEAAPMTGEDSDIQTARLQTKLLRYLWHSGTRAVRRRMVQLLWWTVTTGISWIHPHFDPFEGQSDEFGPAIPDDADDAARKAATESFRQKLADRLGRTQGNVGLDANGKIRLARGEVAWDIVSGFNVSEPEFCSEVAEAELLIHTRWKSMEWIKHHYPEAAGEITPDFDSKAYLESWRAFYAKSATTEGHYQSTAPNELVQVHSLWRPHRPWCPAGAHVVVADQKVLKKGPHPYKHGELPFVPVSELPAPSFRPNCTVAMLMTLQGGRNRLRSQAVAAITLTVAPKTMAEKRTGLKPEDLDAQARLLDLPTGAINAVKPYPAPKLPAHLVPLDRAFHEDMQDVGGIHSSSRGRGDFSGQTGRHAALMQQSDVREGFVARELLATGIAQAGAQSLALWWQYVEQTRQVTMTGTGLEDEPFEFAGVDLAPQWKDQEGVPPFDVRVRLGRQPDLQANAAMLEALTKLGYRTGKRPADRMWALRLMDDAEGLSIDDGDVHRTRAQRENRRILKGEKVRAAYGDDDEVHIYEHDRAISSEEHRTAVAKKPDIEQAYRTHRLEHQFQQARKALEPEMIGTIVKARLQAELEAVAGPGDQPRPPAPQADQGLGLAEAEAAAAPRTVSGPLQE